MFHLRIIVTALRGLRQNLLRSMLATLGLLRDTNLDASSSATAYREAVRRVSGDQRAQNKLAELGIDPLDNQTGKIKDLVKIIAQLQPALAELNAKERNLALTRIFGVRGQKVFNAVIAGYSKLLKKGEAKVGDFAAAHTQLIAGLDGATGAAAKTREALLATAKGQSILLKGSVETFKVMLGQTLTPVLLPAVKAVTSALNFFITIMKEIPEPMRDIISNTAGIFFGIVALVGAVKLLKGLFSIMSSVGVSATGKLGGALGGLVKGLPLIALGIAGVISVISIIRADAKAIEAERQKRTKLLRRELKQAELDFRKVEMAANRARNAAAAATKKLVEQARGSRKVAKKNLFQIEETIRKQIQLGRKASAELLFVQETLRTRTLTAARRKELRGEEKKLLDVKRMAQIRGIAARRQLKFAKNTKERQKLLRIEMVGRLITFRRESQQLKVIETKAKQARNAGLTAAAKAHEKAAAKLRKKIGVRLFNIGQISGARKGAKQADILKAGRKFASGELATLKRFGTEQSEFFAAAAAGGRGRRVLPTEEEGAAPATAAKLTRFRKFLQTQDAGGTRVGAALGIRAEKGAADPKILIFLNKVTAAIATAKAREQKFESQKKAKPGGIATATTVNLTIDGQKLGQIMLRQQVIEDTEGSVAVVATDDHPVFARIAAGGSL